MTPNSQLPQPDQRISMTRCWETTSNFTAIRVLRAISGYRQPTMPPFRRPPTRDVEPKTSGLKLHDPLAGRPRSPHRPSHPQLADPQLQMQYA